MKNGNVLVIGNSGVGKSTLINSVLGDDAAETGSGIAGTTTELKFFTNDMVPFRLIDTVGFEPSPYKARKAINAVKKWSKNAGKEGNEDNIINVIWFCVDGTTRKLFTKTLEDLSRATSMWKSVPLIVVITKSYSELERKDNTEMVKMAFAAQKRNKMNLREIIPVVASTYPINDTAFAPPYGITELIDATNTLMPEGIKAGEKDLFSFKLNRKRALAHSIVGACTVAAVTVGAIPIPLADTLILTPVEIGEINALAHIYGINEDEESKKMFKAMVEIGTVGMAAKAAISALKAIPGINLAASVVNAIIAGSIVAAIGEGSIYVFEKLYLGEKSVTDIEWIKKVMEAQLSSNFVEKVEMITKQISDSGNSKDLGQTISGMSSILFNPKNKNDM